MLTGSALTGSVTRSVRKNEPAIHHWLANFLAGAIENGKTIAQYCAFLFLRNFSHAIYLFKGFVGSCRLLKNKNQGVFILNLFPIYLRFILDLLSPSYLRLILDSFLIYLWFILDLFGSVQS